MTYYVFSPGADRRKFREALEASGYAGFHSPLHGWTDDTKDLFDAIVIDEKYHTYDLLHHDMIPENVDTKTI